MIDKYINKVITGDCLEAMKNIPDNSVDITFADPPFNLKKRYNGYKDNKEFNTYLAWCKQWIYEMVRITKPITKPTGSIFVHNIPKWLSYYSNFLNEIAYFKHWISWDAPSAPMGKTLQPSHYGILYYVKDIRKRKFYEIRYPRKCGYLLKDYGGKKASLHPFGPLVSDVWTDIHRIKHNKYRDEHPCQLPIHLLERIILMSTDENDIVLDPFVGTGTTVIAAKRLGRRFIGIDIDEVYVNITKNKLSKELPNSKVGDVWVSFYLDKIVTIRNIDWAELARYFLIPENIKEIDFTNIKFKKQTRLLKYKRDNILQMGIKQTISNK